MKILKPLLLAAALSPLAAFAEQEVIITSNDTTNGDAIAGPSLPVPILSTPGFVYTNTRIGSVNGINDTLPRSGNGSLFQSLSDGNGKADVEFYAGLAQGTAFASLGKLDDLSTLSYEYFRDSASTSSDTFAPALRLLVDADGDGGTTNDRGYLVYEQIYNKQRLGLDNDATEDAWTTEDALAGPVWLRQFTPSSGFGGTYSRTIEDWVTSPNPGTGGSTLSLNTGNAVVYGFSMGIGSGWNGSFQGGIDNVRIGFGESEVVRYNFEQSIEAVPEPATMAVLGLGALGLLKRRRKSA